jgi:hypothetical protein
MTTFKWDLAMVSNDRGVESHSRLSVGHGMNKHNRIKDEYHSKWIKSLAQRMNLCTKRTAVKMLSSLDNENDAKDSFVTKAKLASRREQGQTDKTVKLHDLLRRS